MEFFGYGRKTTPQKSAGPAAALQEIMQQEFEIDAVGSEFMPSLPQYDMDLEPDEAPRATRDFTPLEVPVGRRGGPKKRSSSLPPSMVREQAQKRIDDWAACYSVPAGPPHSVRTGDCVRLQLMLKN